MTCEHVLRSYGLFRVDPLANAHEYATWQRKQPLEPLQIPTAFFKNLIRNDRQPLYGLAAINRKFTGMQSLLYNSCCLL